MRESKAKVLHSSAEIRTIGVTWLDEHSLIFARNSGAVEMAPARGPGQAPPRLVQLVPGRTRLVRMLDGSVGIINGDECLQVALDKRALVTDRWATPVHVSQIGAWICIDESRHVLCDRNGVVWMRENDGAWVELGHSRLRDICCGSVVNDSVLALGSTHGEVEVLSLVPFTPGMPLRVHADAVQALAPLAGLRLASVSRDRTLRVWRVSDTLELEWSIPDLHSHFINCLLVVGEYVWTGSSDGTIAITSIADRKMTRVFRAHADAVRHLECSPDGTCVVSLSDDGTVHVYESDSLDLVGRHGTPRQYTRCADFHLETGRFVLGNTSGAVQTGALQGSGLVLVQVSEDPIRSICFLDASHVIAGDDGGAVWLMELREPRPRIVALFSSGVTCLSVGRGNVWVGTRDGVVRVLLEDARETEGQGWRVVAERRVHESIVGDIASERAGRTVTCSDDHTLRVSAGDTLAPISTSTLDSTAINNILLVDEALIATSDGGAVFILNRNTHAIERTFREHRAPVRAATAVSHNLVATGDKMGVILIWDWLTCKCVLRLRFQERIIRLNFRQGRLAIVTEAEVATADLRSFFSPAINVAETGRIAPSQPAAGRGGHHPGMAAVAAPALEVTLLDRNQQLDPNAIRIIRQFAEEREGVRCDVAQIGGGLSGAQVFRVQVYDAAGALRIRAIAKIGDRVSVELESSGYAGEVSRLAPGATPRWLAKLELPRGGQAGVFYSLSKDYNRSLFDVALDSDADAARVVSRLQAHTSPWREGVPERHLSGRVIRQSCLADDKLAELMSRFPLGWASDFEDSSAQVRLCTVHGDLHGSNVLVASDLQTMIIDYGDIKVSSAALDPITTEFSFFFSADGPLRNADWPRPEQAAQWRTANYLEGCPIPEFIEACWSWQDEVSAGNRDIAYAAYAYLVRQLKYPDTSKDRASALLRGVRALYGRT